MGQITRYYAVVFLLFAFQTVFNIQLAIRYSGVTCFEQSTARLLEGNILEGSYNISRILEDESPRNFLMDGANSGRFLFLYLCSSSTDFLSPIQKDRFLQTNVTDALASLDVSSLNLKVMPILIGITYAILTGVCLLTTLQLACLSDRTSKNFASPNFFFRCFGCLLRLFSPLMTLAHLIALIFICVQFYFIFGMGESACLGTGKTAYLNTNMFNECRVVNIVTAIIWFLVHVVGPRIRAILYKEPFLYEPFDPDKGTVVKFCCTTLGL